MAADPPQRHPRPAERVPAGTGIGAAFDRLPDEVRLDGGVTVRWVRVVVSRM